MAIFGSLLPSLLARSLRDTSAIVRYEKTDWLHWPVDDVGDIVSFMPGYQLFDFLDYGQPRYVAPLNMLPHQVSIYRGAWLQNDRLNGMFNARLLSIDMLDRVQSFGGSTLSPHGKTMSALSFDDINNVDSEPHSRIRYWEGDFSSFDLSLLLAERLSPKTDLYLAGFNRGYDGFRPNSAYTGVKYDGRLIFYPDAHRSLVLSFGLNRQKNGMQNTSAYSDYNRSNSRDFVGFDYQVQPDTTQGFSTGAHYTHVRRNVHSTVDSFFVEHRYDQGQFYLQKKFHTNAQDAAFRMQVNQDFVWGTAYNLKKSLTRYVLSGHYNFRWFDDLLFESSGGIEQENNFKTIFNLNSRLVFHTQSTDVYKLGISYQQRNSNVAERYFSGFGFTGKNNLDPESVGDAYFVYEKHLTPGLLINAQFGYKNIVNEILPNETKFTNGAGRSWGYALGGVQWSFWKMRLRGTGHLLSAKTYLAPMTSLTGVLSYHDVWLKGALVLDLSAMGRWNDRSNRIMYNPLVERFYWGNELRESFTEYKFKAVATVDDARIYFMIENPFVINYHIIEGYKAYARRVRFGLNWDFWN